MKVVFLQNVLFEYRVPFYNGLAARGYEVTVVHSADRLEGNHHFEQVIVPTSKLGPFYAQPERPSLDQFDVVIAMFDLHWPGNVLPAMLSRKVRYIFWGHGLGRSGLGNKLRIALANRADAMVLYTEPGRQKMLEAGLKAEKSYVANNTVEVSNHEGKHQVGNSFLYVGRLQARKRIDLLMRAFARLVEAVPQKEFALSIVGDGNIRSELEALAESLNIAQFTTFYGAVTDNEILKPIFHQALAYVSPGHLGLGLNHALAFGVPIISSGSVTHAPEVAVLTPRNSIMIEGGSDEETVGQLTDEMVRLGTDDELALKLSQQSYQDYVDFCSMDRMIDGFVDAIEGR